MASNSSDFVRRTLAIDPAVRRDLARRVVNVRALARHIQKQAKEEGLEMSLDAIIASIRRYPLGAMELSETRTRKLLERLSMRNNVVDVAILSAPEVSSMLGNLASKIDYVRGETFRMVSGVRTVKVVIDERNLNLLFSIVPKKYIIKKISNLAEIVISIREEGSRTPGVVTMIAGALSTTNVNVLEFISCAPDLILIVDERDAIRIYDILEKLRSRP